MVRADSQSRASDDSWLLRRFILYIYRYSSAQFETSCKPPRFHPRLGLMAANDAVQDEIISINSIFDEGTLTLLDDATSLCTCSLRLPFLPSVTLRVEFPVDYPDAPPSIMGTQSVGQEVAKGMGSRVVEVVRHVLAQVFRPGENCLYDLLEETREVVEKEEERIKDQVHEEQHQVPEHDTSASNNTTPDLGPEPPWTVAPPIIEKKSVFIARAAPVTSPLQAKQYVAHLLATDKKAARATHNMTAWRIRGPNETSYQDCDDDGETAAGGRMLHLMQLMDVWDVMVVVTRWYGGVHLGPDRFRIINTASRQALIQGGFAKEGKEADGKKKGKK
ncbi:unnamed protein product [Periconia digitata]|uniref:RWD domain-containing protein n=1 Tax=Periconia digitata TaxID=1303443 RepID=A0A9W4U777_9PLEO|nr:unnamed protein product [Periconia digitata]